MPQSLSAKRRLAFFLPNSFTALNMGCGFLSILLAINGLFYEACLVLILGAVFDMVDGRIARVTGTQSAFGEQFDSLSDLISFGVAPAFIFYLRFFDEMDRLGIVVSFIFLLCGALRLARFNANIERVNPAFFQGLPIPSGALALIGLVLLSTYYEWIGSFKYLAAVYAVFYGMLMISNIPFNSFKSSPFVKKYKKFILFGMFILTAITFLHEQIMIFFNITVYVVGSLIYFSTHKKVMANIFDWVEPEDDIKDGHKEDIEIKD